MIKSKQAGRLRCGPGPGLTTLILRRVGLVDLIVEPHVGHRHPVLGQGSGFV